MLRFIKWLILAPIFAFLLLFAVLNRQNVLLSFNPFETAISELQFEIPLFLLLFIVFALGCVSGAVLHWMGQGPQRRHIRNLKLENEHLRQRLTHLPHLPEM